MVGLGSGGQQEISYIMLTHYVSTAEPEKIVDLEAVNAGRVEFEKKIIAARKGHNQYLKELGLSLLP